MEKDYMKGVAVESDETPRQQIKIHEKHVRNKAGGFVFKVDNFDRLKRFLILGAESGAYYAEGQELKVENVTSVVELINEGKGKEVVNILKDFSVNGRCPKQATIVYCLALCARFHDGNHSLKYVEARREAYKVLADICRIPTDLFQFVEYCENISKGINEATGWGRSHRRAISKWYLDKGGRRLAFLVTKYKQRNGWSHKDLLTLSHPKVGTERSSLAVIFKYILKGFEEAEKFVNNRDDFPSLDQDVCQAFGLLYAVNEATKIGNSAGMSIADKENKLIQLIDTHDLVREHMPTNLLTSLKVWYHLLLRMPMTALIRNLGKMSSMGMFVDSATHKGCEIATTVCGWLKDEERLHKARIHPFKVLVALKIYESGHGDSGSKTWTPNPDIVAALNETFHLSFKHVMPTNKRYLLGIDVSGSMAYGGCHGCKVITPREASAAMAMVALRTEPTAMPMAFARQLVPLNIDKDMTLQEVMKETSKLAFGATDCAQPMLYALKNRIAIDVFIIYTDSDTWVGRTHPYEALQQYRREMNLPEAKLIVCAMSSSGFTIADPTDPGMLDMVGFDTAAPEIIANFALKTLVANQ